MMSYPPCARFIRKIHLHAQFIYFLILYALDRVPRKRYKVD